MTYKTTTNLKEFDLTGMTVKCVQEFAMCFNVYIVPLYLYMDNPDLNALYLGINNGVVVRYIWR